MQSFGRHGFFKYTFRVTQVLQWMDRRGGASLGLANVEAGRAFEERPTPTGVCLVLGGVGSPVPRPVSSPGSPPVVGRACVGAVDAFEGPAVPWNRAPPVCRRVPTGEPTGPSTSLLPASEADTLPLTMGGAPGWSRGRPSPLDGLSLAVHRIRAFAHHLRRRSAGR